MHDGDPYVDTPSEFPDDPAYDKAGRGTGATRRRSTGQPSRSSRRASRSCPGPRPRPRRGSSRCSRRSASSRCTLLAARLAREQVYAAALVGWNPLFAIHFAGGGHNDSILIALDARRTRPRCRRAATARRRGVGAGRCCIKWVPLVFFALRAVAARAARRPVGHVGFAVGGRGDHRPRDLALRHRLGALVRPARPERGGAVELRAPASARAARRAARAHGRARGRRARRPGSSGSGARRRAAGSGSGSRAACCSRRRPG